MQKLTLDEKYELITRNLQEVIGIPELKEILKERDLKIYWGTATTGRPHIAYFLPILKIRDFLEAGCEVTILLADIHAFLDNLKAPIKLVDLRAQYYSKTITAMLKSINVDISKLKFVLGSTFQKSESYVMDLYRLTTMTSERDAKKAGTQVVKQVENPMISSLIYPGMQALDEEYLNVDAQFGGVDQRKIFTFAMKYLPMLNYKKRIHLMNPMIAGLNGGKMSASEVYSKIDLIDNKEKIKKKIKKCFCEEGKTDSGIFEVLKFILFPVCKIKNIDLSFKTTDGNEKTYVDFEELKNDAENNLLHPMDIKSVVGDLIEKIVEPVREELLNERDLIVGAYPELCKELI